MARPEKAIGKVIEPKEPINLGDVLFPWRFDLVKRAEFFDVYFEYQDTWERDQEAFIELLRQMGNVTYLHPLVTAKRYAEFVRRESWGNPTKRHETLFVGNVRKFIWIYKSIAKNGWDPNFPIKLKRLSTPRLPVSGRPLTNNVVFSDGQHRVITLIAMGQRELQPNQYKIVEIISEFDPLETTDCYIKHGLCTEKEFCDFARWRFPVPEEITDTYYLYEWGMDNNIASWWDRYMRDYWEEAWCKTKTMKGVV